MTSAGAWERGFSGSRTVRSRNREVIYVPPLSSRASPSMEVTLNLGRLRYRDALCRRPGIRVAAMASLLALAGTIADAQVPALPSRPAGTQGTPGSPPGKAIIAPTEDNPEATAAESAGPISVAETVSDDSVRRKLEKLLRLRRRSARNTSRPSRPIDGGRLDGLNNRPITGEPPAGHRGRERCLRAVARGSGKRAQ
jgi:hypothetical protein